MTSTDSVQKRMTEDPRWNSLPQYLENKLDSRHEARTVGDMKGFLLALLSIMEMGTLKGYGKGHSRFVGDLHEAHTWKNPGPSEK